MAILQATPVKLYNAIKESLDYKGSQKIKALSEGSYAKELVNGVLNRLAEETTTEKKKSEYRGPKHPKGFDAHPSRRMVVREGVLIELSKETLGNYVKRSATDMGLRMRDYGKGSSAALDKATKRNSGIKRAVKKLTEEEKIQLHEVSRDLLSRYVGSAVDSVAALGKGHGRDTEKTRSLEKNRAHPDTLGYLKDLTNKADDKISKRREGIMRAVKKLSEGSSVDEAMMPADHANKIKMLYHTKEGLKAKTHDTKVYLLNPEYAGAPRVGDVINPEHHQLTEGEIDYPDNAKPMISREAAAEMLRNVQKISGPYANNIEGSHGGSRSTHNFHQYNSPIISDDDDIDEEVLDEVASELEAELKKAAKSKKASFEVEFEDGDYMEIDSVVATKILSKGNARDLAKAGKNRATFTAYLKKVAG